MPARSGHFWNDCLAGLTIFFTIAYIAFANPAVLSPLGIPAGAVFFGTCVVAGLGSILCGIWADTPTAMAPGVAFNVFIVSYAQYAHMSWRAVLLVCLVAGLVMVGLSITNARQVAINAIPVPLRLAVVGGIGAILVDQAIKTLHPATAASGNGRTVAFAAGLVVIVLGYIGLRSFAATFARATADTRGLAISWT
jgi:adenine/guanine/hypoxanthine permease